MTGFKQDRSYARVLGELMILAAVVVCLCTGAGEAVADGPPDRLMNLKADFGAVGDGVADDTEALQAAFDSRASVFIPEGTYRFTKRFAVSLRR